MKLDIDIQRAAESHNGIPVDARLTEWIGAALEGRCDDVEISLRVVGEEEGRRLNRRFRGKDRATNVLSFPAAGMDAFRPRPLGDLVICAPLVTREAAQQGKKPDAHWAHLCVHGALHLLGYDHQEAEEAREMEGLEVEILARLGYQDPYRAEA